ncbi:hypothetical protein D3C71_1825000 [compost metagenome]
MAAAAVSSPAPWSLPVWLLISSTRGFAAPGCTACNSAWIFCTSALPRASISSALATPMMRWSSAASVGAEGSTTTALPSLRNCSSACGGPLSSEASTRSGWRLATPSMENAR